MKKLAHLVAIAWLAALPRLAPAAVNMATPDPAQVARYTQDAKAREAKLAQCKKINLQSALADVGCMSAEQAHHNKWNKLVTTSCSAADTFVYIPPGTKGKELEQHLRESGPAEAELKNCGLTKEAWVQQELKKRQK